MEKFRDYLKEAKKSKYSNINLSNDEEGLIQQIEEILFGSQKVKQDFIDTITAYSDSDSTNAKKLHQAFKNSARSFILDTLYDPADSNIKKIRTNLWKKD